MAEPTSKINPIAVFFHVIVALIGLLLLFQILGAAFSLVSSIVTLFLLIAVTISIICFGILIALWTLRTIQ